MTHKIELELNDKEKEVLDQLCKDQDLTEQNLLRAALRIYQLVYHFNIDITPPTLKDMPRGCGGDE